MSDNVEENNPNDKLHVIDPTKNVLDLVRAESRYQDAMRVASDKYQDGMRTTESKRIDDLAEQKWRYEKTISDILTVQVKTTSELISTQLDKVTTNLATQIGTQANGLGDRITALERFRWEVGGKTSGQQVSLATMIAVAAVVATLASAVMAYFNHTIVIQPPMVTPTKGN